ncbi:tetratricopeptide repeat protein [Vibrio viridaestus]|nr:tetratricopeptide repeat protein [Vibrio viridaestus]
MLRKVALTLMCCIGLTIMGCAGTSTTSSSFPNELYDGKNIETFKLKDMPKTEVEAIERGDKALSQANYDLALFEYIRSLELPKGQYKDKTLYSIGRIHQSRGNLRLAEKAYLLALENNPNNIQVLERLGVIYSKQGNVDQGKAYFLRAVNADQIRFTPSHQTVKEPLNSDLVQSFKVNKDSPELAYMGLGILYDIKAQHNIAQAFYRRSLLINPDSLKSLTNMGYSYYMSKDYDEAQRTTLAALKLDPNNEKAQNNLALIYLAKNQPQKALSLFMNHMEKPQALNNVGYFLMLQGHPEEAVPYLQQAINENPLYYQLANENLERALREIRIKGNQ